MTKGELRKIYLRKRLALTDAEYQELNAKVCENFFASIRLTGISTLHTFLPIAKNHEVNTWLIIDRISEDFPGIRISIPRINNRSSELEHYYYEGPAQLETNTWGIPEPVQGIPTAVDKIDAVLVPLLAFDKRGHRLGYGRGFYDRFLSGCRKDCVKIGLSFFEAEEKIEGVDETDIPMDVIVTASGFIVAGS